MNTVNKEVFQFEFKRMPSKSFLEPIFQSLLDQAIKTRENAYAPYSNFQVGAAVLMDNGVVVLGNNQENAAYPSGLCAERVAIFHAAANYPNVPIKAIAISASDKNTPTTTPASSCGNCRQAMAEYEQKQQQPISLLCMGASGEVIQIDSVLSLLPFAFSSEFLK